MPMFFRSPSRAPAAACSSAILVVVAIIGLGFPTTASASEVNYRGPQLVVDYDGPITVDNTRFLYPSSEKLAFRTERYLEEQAPHLIELRPAIDTWAARLGVHPRVLSHVADDFFRARGDIENGPSPETLRWTRERAEQIMDLAAGLVTVFGTQGSHPLAASRAVAAVSGAYDFTARSHPELAAPKLDLPVVAPGPVGGGSGPPLFGYFQPPWERGDTWAGGGAHGDTGSGDQNALDFWGSFRNWGSGDIFQWWVAAAQAGTARVWSTCFVTIIHGNGWETNYYHLENIQVSDMQQVQRDDRLSNYADDEAQATCQGGFSSGPHVHFSVEYQGARVIIDEANVDFTSWSHHVGSGQYDSNCSRSWYTLAAGSRVCPNQDALPNDSPDPGGMIFEDGFESGSIPPWQHQP